MKKGARILLLNRFIGIRILVRVISKLFTHIMPCTKSFGAMAITCSRVRFGLPLISSSRNLRSCLRAIRSQILEKDVEIAHAAVMIICNCAKSFDTVLAMPGLHVPDFNPLTSLIYATNLELLRM